MSKIKQYKIYKKKKKPHKDGDTERKRINMFVYYKDVK